MQAAIAIPIVNSAQARANMLDLGSVGLESMLKELGHPRFRANQILKWIHQKHCFDFEQMSNLPLKLRQDLSSQFTIALPEIDSEYHSKDGTIKWLIQPHGSNNNLIETIYIPEKNRATLCISSQIGCILDCKFCHTGQQGFNRNLKVSEIIGQVLQAQLRISQLDDPNLKPITNIVFMGMGEPLLNEKNVITCLDLLLSDQMHGFSKYRVTVSTVGIVPAMKRLKLSSPASLALSLHAPNDDLRREIMPINDKYSLKQLMDICREYFNESKKRKVTIEYIMIDKINDQKQHAIELAQLLKTIPCKINLIPFNPFPGSEFIRSTPEAIKQFQARLMKSGFVTTIRAERGSDILGACGQLAGMVQNRKKSFSKPQKEHVT